MTVEFADVPGIDGEVVAEVSRRRDRLPVGLLGMLGPAVDLLAGIRGRTDGPISPQRTRLVMFAADHGVADRGLSAWPLTETARRATDLAAGAGWTAQLAASAQVGVLVMDVGVDADLQGTAVDSGSKIRRSSGAIDVEDALTLDQAVAAVTAGRDAADREVDAGADLLIGAVCGVGVSTPSAALVAAITGMEPVNATTRGSGIDDAAWIRKAAAVRDALYRCELAGSDVLTMLATAGGADLAALTGFIAQAAIRRTPVLVDDVPSTLAAILAHRLAPGADAAVLVAALAPERTHDRLLSLLGGHPLLDLGFSGGLGTGALLVVPLLRAAATLVDGAETTPDHSPDAITGWDAGLL